MQSLFTFDTFSGFGPSHIHPGSFQACVASATGRRQLRAGIREQVPRLPGIYGMIDRKGRLIYVGKAKSLRCRLMSYFRVKSRDPKAGRIMQRVETITWETGCNEFAALVRELELIQRFRPRFNVQGQPGNRRYMYLALGRSPVPYAYATREPTGRELALYGPLVGAAHVREAARRLNDAFGLRDCSSRQTMRFAGQPDLFDLEFTPGCLRHAIGTCLGPCAGLCSQKQYSRQIDRTKQFLDGVDRSLLKDLEREMLDASAALQFERAMAVRDKLADLKWLTDRLVWLKHARQDHSFIYPLTGPDERTVWYLIDRGQVQHAAYPPRTRRQREAVQKLITSTYAERRPTTLMPRKLVDSVLLVAAWFRKRPEERALALTPEAVSAELGI